jgi:flagellar biosynthesis protein FlhB
MTDTPAQPSPTTEQQRSLPARLWHRFWNRATQGGTFQGYLVFGLVVIALIYVLLFGFALIQAVRDANWAASFFGYLRDLVSIALSLTGLLIVIGIGVILIQIARFVNLLRSEVKPITHDAQEAAKNVKTTSEFVQKQAVEPIIKSQAFFAGLLRFLREIVSITRLLRQRDDEETSPTTSSTEATTDE